MPDDNDASAQAAKTASLDRSLRKFVVLISAIALIPAACSASAAILSYRTAHDSLLVARQNAEVSGSRIRVQNGLILSGDCADANAPLSARVYVENWGRIAGKLMMMSLTVQNNEMRLASGYITQTPPPPGAYAPFFRTSSFRQIALPRGAIFPLPPRIVGFDDSQPVAAMVGPDPVTIAPQDVAQVDLRFDCSRLATVTGDPRPTIITVENAIMSKTNGTWKLRPNFALNTSGDIDRLRSRNLKAMLNDNSVPVEWVGGVYLPSP